MAGKKYLKLSVLAAVSLVALALACFKTLTLSSTYQQNNQDQQLNLISQHHSIQSYFKHKNHAAVDQQQQASLSQSNIELQSYAGLLSIESLTDQDKSHHWLANKDTTINAEVFEAAVIADIWQHSRNQRGSGFTVRLAGVDYRAMPVWNENLKTVHVLFLQGGYGLVYVQILLCILVLVLAISGMIYCVHVLIYQKRKSRWLSRIKNEKTDPLTGLPNQQKLMGDIEKTTHTNLAFIKIHGYNSILNTYGPAIVDDVIKQISAVMAAYTHPKLKNFCCYHIQQDLFATLEDQDISYEELAEATQKFVRSVTAAKYKVGDGEYISVNVTVGATRKKQDAFMLANMALQEAEQKKLQFYLIDSNDSWLPETYKRDLALTQMLLTGLQERRLVAYYQPIFSAHDRQVVKYECLARLIDENGDIQLMPNVFIPLAHRANVYYLVTQIMIKHAVSFAQENKVVVSLNLSISDIQNRKTCEYLFKKLKSSGVGHLMQFELLENEAIIESDVIIEFIEKLQQYGCQVGMDDLGKGHSNIERLVNLPIDFVKIDRTIMENVAQNLEMQNLARGIVKLSHKNNLNVVAEYCSDHLLTNIAVDLGVDYLQGHYLGMPSKYLFSPNLDIKKVC